MARPLRLEYRGAIWHVTSRGNERRDIYFDDRDRFAFLEILAGVVGLYDWIIHAWVLMRNHLLLNDAPDPLGLLHEIAEHHVLDVRPEDEFALGHLPGAVKLLPVKRVYFFGHSFSLVKTRSMFGHFLK